MRVDYESGLWEWIMRVNHESGLGVDYESGLREWIMRVLH